MEGVGRAGHAARAVVFAIIGWSLVRAGWLNNEGAAKGLGEALLSLRDNGMVYTLVAIGLLLFGAFSLVTAENTEEQIETALDAHQELYSHVAI